MDEAKVRALVGKLRKSADKYEEMAQQEKLDLLSKKWLEGGAVCRMEDADMLEALLSASEPAPSPTGAVAESEARAKHPRPRPHGGTVLNF